MRYMYLSAKKHAKKRFLFPGEQFTPFPVLKIIQK